MSASVHGLLHLPDAVRDLGPLWSHSCFPFENANGELLKLCHGSQALEKPVHMYVYMCMWLHMYRQASHVQSTSVWVHTHVMEVCTCTYVMPCSACL